MDNERVKILINLLNEKNLKIATTESCTSGELVSTLTNIEGSSSVVVGGYVTYSTDQKKRIGVSSKIIDKYTVYSAECANEMAKVAHELTDAEVTIGVTGNFSNIDPNNNGSTPGKVYISILYNGIYTTRVFSLIGDELNMPRKAQKEIVVSYIINETINFLEKCLDKRKFFNK